MVIPEKKKKKIIALESEHTHVREFRKANLEYFSKE